MKPLTNLGPDYETLAIPAVPAADLQTQETHSPDHLPNLFRDPLLKTSETTSIIGRQSGRRSALVPINDKWYRLKGCGDLSQGFPVAPVDDNPQYIQLRGSMFEHTCKQELYMTNLINSLLNKNKIKGANKPIGWWCYESEKFEKPKIIRYCAIYETEGDKRLGDHVIVGLERLLPLMFPNFQLETVMSLFPASRLEESPNIMETWMSVLMDDEGNDLVDINVVSLPENPPSFPEGIASEKYRELWESCVTTLKSVVPLKEGSLLGLLFWKLGREAGIVQRVMKSNDISWGTYDDLLGVHCNGHTNNLVLLQNGENLLAPLDFDMAFTRKSFTRLNTQGNRDDKLFDELLFMEQKTMKMCLAGSTEINSGVKGIAQLPSNFLPLKWAFRDTMVKGFLSGFNGQDDIHPLPNELFAPVKALLELALIMTEKDIA